MIARLDRMNPVMVCSGVVRRIAQHALKQRDSLLFALLRLACFVISILDGVRKKDARLNVLGILLHQLAENHKLLRLIATLRKRCSLGSFDIKLLVAFLMTLQPNRLRKSTSAIDLLRSAAKPLNLNQTPPAHGTMPLD